MENKLKMLFDKSCFNYWNQIKCFRKWWIYEISKAVEVILSTKRSHQNNNKLEENNNRDRWWRQETGLKDCWNRDLSKNHAWSILSNKVVATASRRLDSREHKSTSEL